jgi:uncharacterized protein YdeI (YjbR/CyaY-like superfamily)
MSPKVDSFLKRQDHWRAEFEKLRDILLDCGLDEDLKWGQPCYSVDGKNVILMHGFKEYCAVLFPKGVLLEDTKGVLVQQTENVQSARQIRFTNVKQIEKLAKTIKAYVYEAVEVERSGVKVPMKETKDFKMPVELKSALDGSKALKKAFEALTPGRQRAYMLFIGQAKQAKTREARVEKYVEKILDGKGLDD